MNEPRPHQQEPAATEPHDQEPYEPGRDYAAAKELSDKVLAELPPKDRQKVVAELKLLDNVGRFIGRDFDMPVLVGAPGASWSWHTLDNFVIVNPTDLLESDSAENLWSVGHEASHRRITRNTDNVMPMLHEPGGALLRNVIEDPRVNNYLSDNYSLLDRGMRHYYDAQVQGHEAKAASFASQNGFIPRHDLASFEYIRLWYLERHNMPVQISDGLPDDVRDVVENTLEAAQDAWWTYPTRKEADEGEEMIERYAEASGGTIATKIWPEFEKLIQEDLQDAMTAKKMLEMMQDLVEGKTPDDFEDLDPDLQDMLKAIAEMAKELNQPPQPLKLDDLTEEQMQALKEFMQSLSEEEKQHLNEEGKKLLAEFDTELAESMAAAFDTDVEMSEVPVRDIPPEGGGEPKAHEEPEIHPDLAKYNEEYADVSPQITELYNNLNNIFIARAAGGYEGGYRRGQRINVGRRMQEKAQGISAAQSHAWERRELPMQKDYVVSILVDLSGSMSSGGDYEYDYEKGKDIFKGTGSRVEAAMKSAIVVAEALSKMNIRFEITGFNAAEHVYKHFSDQMSNAVRQNIPGMEQAVITYDANYNDDGWAVGNAADRLRTQRASERLLIVLSDGQPAPSSRHFGPEYELGQVVRDITDAGDIKIASIGIQSSEVARYYPDYAVVNDITELPRELSGVVQRLIEQA